MELLIGGQWTAAQSGRVEEVTSPFDGAVAGSVPVAGTADVDAALTAAVAGAKVWRNTPGHERMRILLQAATLADERAEAIAQTISAEAGKSITEARGEASRSGEMIRLAAFEGTQLYGDSLPLDANRGTGFDKIGFTVRQPVGVVVAITPFNYPALLVMHKLAPALAAGNAVVLKPARATPLTALALAACFVDAGLPDGVLSVLTGAGGELGDALVSDPRVNKISFTGSTGVGQQDHAAGRGEEAVPGAGRVLPGGRPPGCRRRRRRSGCRDRRLRERRAGVHLGAAGDHASHDRDGLPGRTGGAGGEDPDR